MKVKILFEKRIIVINLKDYSVEKLNQMSVQGMQILEYIGA